jgi:hypothetical protein
MARQDGNRVNTSQRAPDAIAAGAGRQVLQTGNQREVEADKGQAEEGPKPTTVPQRNEPELESEPQRPPFPAQLGQARTALLERYQAAWRLHVDLRAQLPELGQARDNAKDALVAEKIRKAPHRHLPLWLVGLLVPPLLMLDTFGAEPSAEAFGLGQLLTFGITAVLVAAVSIGALVVVHSTGRRRLVYFVILMASLALLWFLRVRYVLTASGSLSGAILEASGLSLVTVIIFIANEELFRRAEPLSHAKARRTVRRAQHWLDKGRKQLRNAEDELKAARHAWELHER